MKLYSALMIESFGDLEVTPLEPSEVESIVLPAKSNFGRQSCVQDICGREHGEVCSFLDAVRVYKFEVKRKPMYNMHLSGLSSYDGTAAYINVRRVSRELCPVHCSSLGSEDRRHTHQRLSNSAMVPTPLLFFTSSPSSNDNLNARMHLAAALPGNRRLHPGAGARPLRPQVDAPNMKEL
mmetsp:Transcript_71898/g.191940  ORF Transcript_71898/g.191940 Transcript_71898/m.191940 type:complete len:180 (-) Transcript_71898:323-862(-)